MNLYVVYSLDGSLLETFSSEDNALSFAKEVIQDCNDGEEWSSEVESIVIAKITHTCQEISKRESPSDRYDYLCDYEMKPVLPGPPRCL